MIVERDGPFIIEPNRVLQYAVEQRILIRTP